MRTTLCCLPLLALAFTTSAASAQAVDLPARKAGMWEIQNVAEQGGAPSMTIKACVDEASDKMMMEAGLNMSKSMCPDQTMVQDGNSIVVDATCDFGGMKSKSHTVMTGDFQSSYQVETTSEISGMPSVPGMPAGPTKMTQTATWVGADCTDGMNPGDMLMPGGMKMNVTDMMKMMGGN
jgi:hypothetical protein